ncbi:hypothetical protein PLICRDRAFT_179736 [Plicaturopsis crispa FD-325 SS-3]|uniref:Uncharacterized protein n=1 Tax=Plicaturopsis crispa FD-325 SS-3 TaxID=944288 RepID=A0A0C9T7A5_PLICR|nr:hypothetical protein PLICRDRAFT_179736 [Plicaturopsis crispa FD-325 SS-3]
MPANRRRRHAPCASRSPRTNIPLPLPSRRRSSTRASTTRAPLCQPRALFSASSAQPRCLAVHASTEPAPTHPCVAEILGGTQCREDEGDGAAASQGAAPTRQTAVSTPCAQLVPLPMPHRPPPVPLPLSYHSVAPPLPAHCPRYPHIRASAPSARSQGHVRAFPVLARYRIARTKITERRGREWMASAPPSHSPCTLSYSLRIPVPPPTRQCSLASASRSAACTCRFPTHPDVHRRACPIWLPAPPLPCCLVGSAGQTRSRLIASAGQRISIESQRGLR